MSDAICPDCHLLALEELENGDIRCSICGWQGNTPYRKMMDEEMAHKKWVETNTKLELRAKGALFCHRILLDGNDDDISDTKFEIMKILQLKQLESSRNLILLFRETRLPYEIIDQIKQIKNVQQVLVF